MADFRATMHRVGPRSWKFNAPDVAPMKGHCRVCRRDVAIQHPHAVDLTTGNYVVQGECEACGSEVVLIVS